MTDSSPKRKEPSPAPSGKLKILETELDEFFKDRAHARAAHISDKPKGTCSESRAEDDPSMSGCCMTGCHDCPWGYVVPPLQ